MTVSFTCRTHVGMEPGELFDLARNVDVEFAAPFGALGRLAEKAFLGRYLRNLIEERNEYLARNGAPA